MLRRILSFVCCLCLLSSPLQGLAQDVPALSGVLADDSVLTLSGSWFVEFETALAGELTLTLLGAEGQADTVVASQQVEAGEGTIAWDGTLPTGGYAQEGSAMLMLTLHAGGEESAHMVPVEIVSAGEETPAQQEDVYKRQRFRRCASR